MRPRRRHSAGQPVHVGSSADLPSAVTEDTASEIVEERRAHVGVETRSADSNWYRELFFKQISFTLLLIINDQILLFYTHCIINNLSLL